MAIYGTASQVTGLDLLRSDNQQTTTFDGTFDGGSILASFMVVDGTVDEAINNNAEVYLNVGFKAPPF
ncbi:hypothetical protein [Calothrix sp. CCY 0018]|uniref:hypothetical protein n=1 Tax=Calothrix sp. CCY 0018 TaxID=3103864 RepID=UPI0039C60D11